MKIKLHYKAVMAFALCINKSIAQTSFTHKNSLNEVKNNHANFWPILLIILMGLLALSYILTKAIDKRSDKH